MSSFNLCIFLLSKWQFSLKCLLCYLPFLPLTPFFWTIAPGYAPFYLGLLNYSVAMSTVPLHSFCPESSPLRNQAGWQPHLRQRSRDWEGGTPLDLGLSYLQVPYLFYDYMCFLSVKTLLSFPYLSNISHWRHQTCFYIIILININISKIYKICNIK